MANWIEFFELYAANFGQLTEKDGLNEWINFVENEVQDMGLLIAGTQPYIDRHTAALDNMEPTPRRPTLGQIRSAYYRQIKLERQEQERRRFGDTTLCGLCLGMKKCYVLAPMKDDPDRKRWPTDFRQAYWEDFTGIELVDCPRCSSKKRSAEETTRIEHNSMPLEIPKNHPDFPKMYTSQKFVESTKRVLINLQRKRECSVDNSNAGERTAGPFDFIDSMLDMISTGQMDLPVPEKASGDEAIRSRLWENSKARSRRETTDHTNFGPLKWTA